MCWTCLTFLIYWCLTWNKNDKCWFNLAAHWRINPTVSLITWIQFDFRLNSQINCSDWQTFKKSCCDLCWNKPRKQENWRTFKTSLVDFILVDIHCTRAKYMNWPQSLQSTVWTLQSSWQKLHSWIIQLVVAQVQLCQMGGVGLQSWDQRITADLWQPAVLQPE